MDESMDLMAEEHILVEGLEDLSCFVEEECQSEDRDFDVCEHGLEDLSFFVEEECQSNEGGFDSCVHGLGDLSFFVEEECQSKEAGADAECHDEELMFFEEDESESSEEVDLSSQVGEDMDVPVDCDDTSTLSCQSVKPHNKITINGVEDILGLDLKIFNPAEIDHYDFASLDVAYMFYTSYARANGFCVRRGSVLRSRKTGDILQQDFLCNKNGRREDNGPAADERRRERKRDTRCGCEAKFRVHTDIVTGHWYCTYFICGHNHELFDDMYCRMLAPHRRLNNSDILQMNNMRYVGIGPSQVFRSFANQSGGFENIGFRKKDIYNQISRQKRMEKNDAVTAMDFLRLLGTKDPLMYCEHTVDREGRLQHLFWSDGISQLSYQVYGDVLAFDATYKKNKYLLPLVVFSGVNNHNRSTIFAAAIVSNETEETYVWLLEQLSSVMKGKAPNAVITDGDLAMKNAIKRVFPKAHHRLCAWHLLGNANKKLSKPEFTQEFKNCMLGEYDVGKFRSRWNEMVKKFGLEDNDWVNEMYEKRWMWATAYIRGKFFAGFRTTSRCEGLHSELGKYVHSRYNLTEFLQQYHQCVKHMRFRELEDDFASIHGEQILQTKLQSLERSAANHFTKEIFLLFRPVLNNAHVLRVTCCRDALTYMIYTVCRNVAGSHEWHVSFYSSCYEFRCSCLRMESLGLPCEHIVAVLSHLGIEDLPDSVILKRWTKGAKDGVYSPTDGGVNCWDSQKSARCGALMDLYRVLSDLNSDSANEFNKARESIVQSIEEIKSKKSCDRRDGGASTQTVYDSLKAPLRAKTKGRPRGAEVRSSSSKRTIHCSICKASGHNKATCPARSTQGQTVNTMLEDMDEEN